MFNAGIESSAERLPIVFREVDPANGEDKTRCPQRVAKITFTYSIGVPAAIRVQCWLVYAH